MTDVKQKLKTIKEQKKLLAKEQKEINLLLEGSKAERALARKTQAICRKESHEAKSELNKLLVKLYPTYSKGTSEEVSELAKSIADKSAELTNSMEAFAKASSELEKSYGFN